MPIQKIHLKSQNSTWNLPRRIYLPPQKFPAICPPPLTLLYLHVWAECYQNDLAAHSSKIIRFLFVMFKNQWTYDCKTLLILSWMHSTIALKESYKKVWIKLWAPLLCSYWTLYLTIFYSQYLHYFNAVSFAIYWLSCLQLFHCKQKDIWLTA